jgi:steroid delta-isomerase-like uncharacterized protein
MATDIKKMMDDYKLAWNSHDVKKIISFFTDDGVYEDVATGKVSKGKKEITDYLNSFFIDFPDLKLELKSLFAADDWGGSEIVSTATHAHSSTPGIPTTGKVFSIRGATIFQLHKGKISRQSEYYDQVSFLKQVGLMPGQPK